MTFILNVLLSFHCCALQSVPSHRCCNPLCSWSTWPQSDRPTNCWLLGNSVYSQIVVRAVVCRHSATASWGVVKVCKVSHREEMETLQTYDLLWRSRRTSSGAQGIHVSLVTCGFQGVADWFPGVSLRPWHWLVWVGPEGSGPTNLSGHWEVFLGVILNH